MRRLVSLCCAAVLVSCSKGENQPAADSTALAPPAPPMLRLSDVAGKWHVRTMAETSDSVLVEYDMTATSDTTGWMIMLPNRPPMALRVMASGDSLVIESGPYESVLRKGVQVWTHGVSRLVGGELVGMTVAHYSKGADSVVTLRTRGSRVP